METIQTYVILQLIEYQVEYKMWDRWYLFQYIYILVANLYDAQENY